MFSDSQTTPEIFIDQGSFRDNTGFIFYFNQRVFRAINKDSIENYDFLRSSGLFDSLVSQNLLIEHKIIEAPVFASVSGFDFSNHIVLEVKKVPFISYPYEWCFSQLKNAALCTLKIQKLALDSGMWLKDASAFNVQFVGTNPVFIDILSFEKYEKDKPWIAYLQFCKHFLAPLALMYYKNSEFSKFSQLHLDGIPIKFASDNLPVKSFFNTVVMAHLHFHSRMQKASPQNEVITALSKDKLLGIIEHLENGIKKLELKEKKSNWSSYETENNYSVKSFNHKTDLIESWVKKIKPSIIWDLGCNNGKITEKISEFSEYTVGFDSDHHCVDMFYKRIHGESCVKIIPLVFDITNPSPSIGWANHERKNIFQRGKSDLILALALIHHLRISGNIPFEKMARLMRQWGNWLIIEFIPKEDLMVQALLKNRKDIFKDYNIHQFKNIFSLHFDLIEQGEITGSSRTLFLMRAKQ